ncbi:MAG: hypothetical protein IPP74_09040 [Alphaproteobacteria bacterium]|nr:hypothetical protein [Alphaproteobacteria bacterium]
MTVEEKERLRQIVEGPEDLFSDDYQYYDDDRDLLSQINFDTDQLGNSQKERELFRLIIRYPTMDIIGRNYLIRLDKPLPQYSTEFAKAYQLVDSRSQESISAYALVFQKQLPMRLSAILGLSRKKIPNFHVIYESGIVPLSPHGEKHFVAVVSKPKGQTLHDYVKQRGPITEEFVIASILRPLIFTLKTIHACGVTHGNINPHTIYLDNNTECYLGECISSLPGFSQLSFFEPAERIGVNAYAKGEDYSSIDYYALGLVIISTLVGMSVIHEKSDQELIETRLITGTFNSLIGSINVSNKLQDCLNGLLNDRKDARWNSQQLEPWSKGKRYNLLPSSSYMEASRAIVFNDRQYFNRRSIANALYNHWEQSREFITQDTLIKWLKTSVDSEQIATSIEMILKMDDRDKNKSHHFDYLDAIISRCISLVDTQIPIRFPFLSCHVNGMGAVLACSYSNGKREHTHIITDLLRGTVLDMWQASRDIKLPNYQSAALGIQRSREMLIMKGIGFGLERCYYNMNPTLPCQGRSLKLEYVLTLEEALLTLDKLGESNPSQPLIDRHVAAFIAHRLELPSPIELKKIMGYPVLANDETLHILYLLAIAQRKTDIRKLCGLTNHMIQQLMKIVTKLHSKSLKKDLEARARAVAGSGSLAALFKVMADVGTHRRDTLGFKKASQFYHVLNTEERKINNQKIVKAAGHQYGLHLALMTSYLLSLIVLLLLFSKSIH